MSFSSMSFNDGERFKAWVRSSTVEEFSDRVKSLPPDGVSLASYTLGLQLGEYSRDGASDELKRNNLLKINALADAHNFHKYYSSELGILPDEDENDTGNKLVDWLAE